MTEEEKHVKMKCESKGKPNRYLLPLILLSLLPESEALSSTGRPSVLLILQSGVSHPFDASDWLDSSLVFKSLSLFERVGGRLQWSEA
jgi:hypothetical protein